MVQEKIYHWRPWVKKRVVNARDAPTMAKVEDFAFRMARDAATRGAPTESSPEAYASRMVPRRVNVAPSRVAPTEPSGEAFVAHMARRLNVAATGGAPVNQGGEVFAPGTARRGNGAASRDAPTGPESEDSAARMAHTLPPPGTWWHGHPIPPKDTRPPPRSSQVPSP